MRAENTIITILGRKGTGKTMLIQDILHEYPRRIILDSTGEYETEDCHVAHELKSALDLLVACERDSRFCIVYRPEDDSAALRFLTVAYELHDYVLVIDEANIYMSANSLPTILANFIRRGRHRQIHQIYAAQRATSIHREVTSQSDVIVAFHQHEKRDVDYLRAEGFGERADWLPHLQTHRAIVYAVDERKTPLCVESRRVTENPLTRGHELAHDPDATRTD